MVTFSKPLSKENNRKEGEDKMTKEVKKVTNVKVIVEELLKGGASTSEIANRVVERKPGVRTTGIKNQIKGILKFVKEGKKKWQKYEIAEDGVGLVEKA